MEMAEMCIDMRLHDNLASSIRGQCAVSVPVNNLWISLDDSDVECQYVERRFLSIFCFAFSW